MYRSAPEHGCIRIPFTKEALGIALVESPSAGLPCVMSDGIPPEAILVRISRPGGADATAENGRSSGETGGLQTLMTARRALAWSSNRSTMRGQRKSLAALYRGAALGRFL